MIFTQNPIGSSATEDLQDNAISFDYAMNSPAALWQDRFGKQHKTVQQALKDVGFKPAGFDFVSGGTLGIGDRDKCVFYPTDGYWYSWNGKLPYIVPANSSPTPGGKKGWGIVTRDERIIAREALRRTYQEVGLNLVDGSFEQGGTLNAVTDILLEEKTGKCYSFTGSFPHIVSRGTTPINESVVYQDECNKLYSDQLGAPNSTVLIAGEKASEVAKYKAPFLNSVTRSLKERLQDRVSIRDFYVYGDGTDETAKIHKAVKEVCGAGRTLVVPPPLVGSHYITQPVPFPNTSWKMVGDGGPTIVQFAPPEGMSNQAIFDLTNCNGPAKWLEGIGFGRLTAGSYDGIIGLLTNNSNGLHMSRCWFRGLARGFDIHGTFFELDGNVFEYCAAGINGLSNAKETIIRGTTYYKCEQDIIVPAGDNSTFMHVDSTHIGTKTRAVDLRGDNAYIRGVTARDDGTGYTPIIVRVTNGKANIVDGVLSTFGSDVVRVEGAGSVGNQISKLVVPAGANVQRGLSVSAAFRTILMGADIQQSSIAAVRLDTAADTEIHGAGMSGTIGLSINACSQLRVYGGKLQGTTADTAQDSPNSTNPRFYGTKGNLAPITTAVFV